MFTAREGRTNSQHPRLGDASNPDESTAVVGPHVSASRMEDAPIDGRIGLYVVLDEIGRGGMGRVLRAYDPKLQREVALKVVRRKALGRDGRARLVAEARAMATLSHANVVAVYDVEDGNEVVVVMEHVAGETLQTWMTSRRRTWSEVVAPFVAAGRGLAAAHAAGLMHRDVKPSNVLVSTDGVAKVTDFGLAKRRGVGTRGETARRLCGQVGADAHRRLRGDLRLRLGSGFGRSPGRGQLDLLRPLRVAATTDGHPQNRRRDAATQPSVLPANHSSISSTSSNNAASSNRWSAA